FSGRRICEPFLQVCPGQFEPVPLSETNKVGQSVNAPERELELKNWIRIFGLSSRASTREHKYPGVDQIAKLGHLLARVARGHADINRRILPQARRRFAALFCLLKRFKKQLVGCLRK